MEREKEIEERERERKRECLDRGGEKRIAVGKESPAFSDQEGQAISSSKHRQNGVFALNWSRDFGLCLCVCVVLRPFSCSIYSGKREMADESRRRRPAKWEVILCFAAFCLMMVETVLTVDNLMIMPRFTLIVFLHPHTLNLSYNHNFT